MYVSICAADAGATVEVLDVDDLGRLGVELGDVDPVAAGRALHEAGLGELRGEHAWLVVVRLREVGGGDPAWDERFAGMIRYAAAHGWLDESQTRVRAHVERG